MTWFFWIKRKEREEQKEDAKAALQETRNTARSIKAKEGDAQRLFARIHQLREENHISESVRNLLEGS